MITPQLARYRQAHRIRPASVWSDDLNRIVTVCAHDMIRVAPVGRSVRYRHDAHTITALARGEDVERL